MTEGSSIACQLQTLFNEMPLEEIELATEIIAFAEEKLQTTFSANIYLTLTDHLHYAISRTRQGLIVTNPLLLEIKRFYPEEFAIAKEALNIVHKRFDLFFDDHEAAFITFHFINGRLNDPNMMITTESAKMVHDIMNIISKHYGQVLDENSLSYHRMITHLQYFSRRLLENQESDKEDDDFMYELVKSKYPDAYECTLRINEYLKNTQQKSLKKSEQQYLMIHIQRVTKE